MKTLHCCFVHYLSFTGQRQLCEVKLRKWGKKWLWASNPEFVCLVLLKNPCGSSWWNWVFCLYLVVVFSVQAGCCGCLDNDMSCCSKSSDSAWLWHWWPWYRLPISAEDGETSSLSHNSLHYPNAMGIEAQTFYMFLCVRVKFMFPAVVLCWSLRLHIKVCKTVQWDRRDPCHLSKEWASKAAVNFGDWFYGWRSRMRISSFDRL